MSGLRDRLTALRGELTAADDHSAKAGEHRAKARAIIDDIFESDARARAKEAEQPAQPSQADAPPSAAPAGTCEPFRGRAIMAKHPGVCTVCHVRFGAAARILYNAQLRRAAHLACGKSDGG